MTDLDALERLDKRDALRSDCVPALIAELRTARQDAARYRWWREVFKRNSSYYVTTICGENWSPEEHLDRYTDAAIAKEAAP